jgi:TPR repeat protein
LWLVLLFLPFVCSFLTLRLFFFQDLEKKLEIVTKENSKLKKLAKSQVENIIEPAATKKGDVGAIQVMGECYQFGLGGKTLNEKTATEYYEKGVTGENPASQCSLGTLLVNQDNDEKATERGVELLKKSAASHHPEAQHQLGRWFGRGLPISNDQQVTSFNFFKEAAENGHAGAQTQLALCLEQGFGTEIDRKQAEQWYLKAADSGEFEAQFSLGRIHLSEDVNSAIEWWEKAYYERGSRYACHELATRRVLDPGAEFLWAYRGQMYSELASRLELKSEDFTTLIFGLRRSAVHVQGFGPSFDSLTEMCDEKDKWFLQRRSAVADGSSEIFAFALQLPNNDPNRLKFIRIAAEYKGEPSEDAMWELGLLYETGSCGLQKNLVLAKEWKDKAMANGYVPSAS